VKIITRGQTENYDRFGSMTGNREYRAAWSARLVESIRKENMLAMFPIVCVRGDNGMMNVVDGQHRLAAARELGVPIHYVLVDGLDADSVRIINANMSAWKTSDFLHHYCTLGRHDYIKLAEFCERTGIGLMVAAALMSDKPSTSGDLTLAFRDGKFRITNAIGARKVEAIVAALVASGVKFASGRQSVLALSRIVATGAFDFDVFSRGIDRIVSKLRPCASWQQFAEIFSDAYDYRRPVSDRSDLFRRVMDSERANGSEKCKSRSH